MRLRCSEVGSRGRIADKLNARHPGQLVHDRPGSAAPVASTASIARNRPREALAGWRRVDVTEHRTKADWAYRIRKLVDGRYPKANCIVIVRDNLIRTPPAAIYKPSPGRKLSGWRRDSWKSTTAV